MAETNTKKSTGKVATDNIKAPLHVKRLANKEAADRSAVEERSVFVYEIVAEMWDAYLKVRSMGKPSPGQASIPPALLDRMTQVKNETGKDLQVQVEEALDAYLLSASSGNPEENKLNIKENNLKGIDYHQSRGYDKTLHTLASEIRKNADAILEIASVREIPVGEDTGVPASEEAARREAERIEKLRQIGSELDAADRGAEEIERLLEASRGHHKKSNKRLSNG